MNLKENFTETDAQGVSGIKPPLLPTAWRTVNSAIDWPHSSEEARLFFLSGEPSIWFAELPARWKEMPPWSLLHEYQAYASRVSTANNLRSKLEQIADAFALICECLEANGLTIDDIRAHGLIQENRDPFFSSCRWMVPIEWRRPLLSDESEVAA